MKEYFWLCTCGNWYSGDAPAEMYRMELRIEPSQDKCHRWGCGWVTFQWQEAPVGNARGEPGPWQHPLGTDASHRDYPCGCAETAVGAYGGIDAHNCKEGHDDAR